MSTHTGANRQPSLARARSKVKKWTLKKILLALLVLGIGYLGLEYLLLPDCQELVKNNPETTALIEARLHRAREEGREPRRQQVWVPIDRISNNLIRAVLTGEDNHFFAHNGFDTKAIQKAIEEDWKEFKFKRGASTITQQLAKNLYLSESKNPLRKLKEAVITYRMEKVLSKRRIMEIYLNVIEWGEGIYGAEAAARHHFSKSATQLSTSEAAYLAAMIPNPRTVYNPRKNPRRVAHRQRIILRRMSAIALPRDWR
ncbi:MAG: monofunctional biosynthetic peptidoglycan transglycosylase [Acidobacteriota bacterium]